MFLSFKSLWPLERQKNLTFFFFFAIQIKDLFVLELYNLVIISSFRSLQEFFLVTLQVSESLILFGVKTEDDDDKGKEIQSEKEYVFSRGVALALV